MPLTELRAFSCSSYEICSLDTLFGIHPSKVVLKPLTSTANLTVRDLPRYVG
jgi:hypothetical protein